MFTTLSIKKAKIRKSHRCWGCAEKFDVGSSLFTVTNIDDGRIYTNYWCEVCQAFISTLSYDEQQDGWDIGELKEYDNYQEFKENLLNK